MEKKDKMLSTIESDPLTIESMSLNEAEEEAVKEIRNEEEEEEERKEESSAMEISCSEDNYTDNEEEFRWPRGFDRIRSKGERGEDEESIWTDDQSFQSDSEDSKEDVSAGEDDSEDSEEEGIPFDTSVKFPPEWEDEIKKSPQYKCGMLHIVVEPLALETCPHIDDSKFTYPPQYRGPRIENLHHKLIARIKAIRETRGYDVERGVPYFILGDPFFPVDPQNTETYNKELLDKIMKFVLKQINSHAQAQGCGKRYELVVVEKLVLARPHRVQLITFRAKELSDDAAEENMDAERTIQAMVFTGCCNKFELLEWRFRPEAI